MNASSKERHLANLVRLRRDTDRGTEELFEYVEGLVIAIGELVEQRDELRTETEPVRVEQSRQIARLITQRDRIQERADVIAVESIDKDNLIATLRSQLIARDYGIQERRVEAYQREVERLDKEIERLTSQMDGTRTVVLESMMAGDYAYRSRGNRGIDTIDRLRGPAWSNMIRSSKGAVHPVSEYVRAGDEVELVTSSTPTAWAWRRVG